jgi:hypothetical protein
MNLRLFSSIIIFLFLIFQSTLNAQGLTEPLKRGQFETGYSHYWYHGEFYWSPVNHSNDDWWSNGTLYFRLGLYDIITVSVEGMVWPVNSSNNYPGGSFLNYALGISLSSPSIQLLFLELFLHMHYLENLYLDRSEQKSDKRFRNLLFGIPIRFKIVKSFTIWLAPVYVWNESEYFEDQTYSRSLKSPGVSIGLDALLFEHFYLNFNTIYTDYFQPHIIAGYRF